MSTIRTTVEILNDVRPHGNADALNLATVRGWQMAIKKDERQTGDKVIYFEAGTVLPLEWAEKFGVVNYLSNKTDINGDRVLVVGKVKLRGEPSFGLCVPVDEALALMPEPETAVLFVGDDVSHLFGTSKYRPPVKATAGDAEEDHPHFHAYTDIENMRNFPDIFEGGEHVEATEKLHGTNCRVGFVAGDDGVPGHMGAEGERHLEWMAGSRELRRRCPGSENMEANTYWFPHTLKSVHDLLESLYMAGHKSAILYGEVYGGNVQKGFDYGHRRPHFRAFDLSIDGKYVDRSRFYELCGAHEVETCPVLYSGPYSLDAIKRVADGKTELGHGHIREGVVVRPAVERNHPQIGRVILKYVGDQYLFRKGGDEDDTTDQ